MLADFHFIRPLWLLLLIIPLLGYYFFFSGNRNVSAWENVCDKRLLKFLLVKGNSKQRSLLGYCALMGIIGSIIALSGPSWQKKEVPAFSPVNPVMILLNLSSDMDNNDLRPNRLARAKFAIDDLLKEIQAQVALMVYTNEPYIISPSTEDKKIISNLLPSIDQDIMPENGDKLYRAIDLAVSRMEEEGFAFGNIVVFAPDIGQDFNKALTSAANASSKGYSINVVAVRADKNEKLSMLADKGKGKYVTINEISALAGKINSQISSDLKQSKNLQETWEDYGYWFVFIPLICVLSFFRRGALVVLFLLYSFSAQAGFFTNANQDGAKAFAKGDYEAAAKHFEHPQWKASSLYKQGEYEEAFKYFSQADDTESLYNQGNALAKSGKIEEAIKKYEEVLQVNPQHEDAKFNLEYLKKQQEQQQQQQSQGDENDENDNDGQQSGEQEDQKNENSQGNNSEQQQENNEEQENNNQDSNSQNNQNASAENSDEQQKNSDENQNLQQSSGTDQQNTEEFNAQSTPADSESQEKSDKEAEAQATKNDDKQGEFDEQTQAREMTYRNIPEDAGGLLRAFIMKEHNKNRYGDN